MHDFKMTWSLSKAARLQLRQLERKKKLAEKNVEESSKKMAGKNAMTLS